MDVYEWSDHTEEGGWQQFIVGSISSQLSTIEV